jgi:predicted MFS family arabinose efflux permease
LLPWVDVHAESLRGRAEVEIHMATYVRTLALFNRNVWLFLSATAINGFAFFGIYNLLLNLYLLRMGYGPEFIGWVNAVGPLAFGFGSIPAGIISQRWGSRRALIASYSIILVVFGLLPFAELMPARWQPFWIMVNYALAWLGATLFAVNGAPFMMASTTTTERNHAFALFAALSPVAGFLGNLVGGLLPGFFANTLSLSLDDPAPYRLSLWFAASFYLIAALAMSYAHETDTGSRNTQNTSAELPPYAIIYFFVAVMFLRTGGEWALRIFLNVYLDTVLHAPLALIGTLSAVGQLMGLLALIAPMVMKRWDKFGLITVGTFAMACSYLPILLFANWFVVALSFMGLIAAYSLVLPSYSVLSQESVGTQWRTLLSGAMNMAFGAGISVVAIGGGYIIPLVGYRTLFAVAAGMLLGAALVFWGAFHRAQAKSWVTH